MFEMQLRGNNAKQLLNTLTEKDKLFQNNITKIDANNPEKLQKHINQLKTEIENFKTINKENVADSPICKKLFDTIKITPNAEKEFDEYVKKEYSKAQRAYYFNIK